MWKGMLRDLGNLTLAVLVVNSFLWMWEYIFHIDFPLWIFGLVGIVLGFTYRKYWGPMLPWYKDSFARPKAEEEEV